jgi:hypothetical protein
MRQNNEDDVDHFVNLIATAFKVGKSYEQAVQAYNKASEALLKADAYVIIVLFSVYVVYHFCALKPHHIVFIYIAWIQLTQYSFGW